MSYLRKYGVGAGGAVVIPIIKRAAADFATASDWTPATGDVTISKDGGAAADITSLPVPVAMGNSAAWKFTFTNAELQGGAIIVTVADGAPKAVEDQLFTVETFGNPSALYPGIDLTDGVRLGMTALPNAMAAAAGGLPTVNAANYIAGIAGTKNTFDALNDLSSAQVVSLGLDAPVSSRLSAAAYVAPDNAGIATANAGLTIANTSITDLTSDVATANAGINALATDLSTANAGIEGAQTGVNDLLARLTATRSALLDTLAHLDADISSRLSASAYAAPDNTGIAAIQSKTDNLPLLPAAVGDAMTIDFPQAVPLTNTAQTVGDALNAARAQGFGPWDQTGNILTLLAPDGVTPVHAFTWDDPDNPTSRS